MDWTIRTVMRVFLLVGGLVFVVRRALEGETFELGLGVVAVFLGALGLWWEWQTASADDRETASE